MHVHKTLCPFYTITKMTPATQGRNEGGKGGTIPRASTHYRNAIKSQQCYKHFLQYSTFASERSQVQT